MLSKIKGWNGRQRWDSESGVLKDQALPTPPASGPASLADDTPPRQAPRGSGPDFDQRPPPKPKHRLCPHCSEIDFAQFEVVGGPANSNNNNSSSGVWQRRHHSSDDNSDAVTTHIFPLKSLLQKRGVCNFCALLFQALSCPAHDPLRDPDIQESIQRDEKFREKQSQTRPFYVSFPDWAVVREHDMLGRLDGDAKWPFGLTQDKLKITTVRERPTTTTVSRNGGEEGGEDGDADEDEDEDEDEDDDPGVTFEEDDGDKGEELAAGVVAGQMVMTTGSALDRDGERSRWWKFGGEMLSHVGMLGVMSKNKVPAAVRAVVYGPQHRHRSGVILVSVFGCGRGVNRDLKTLADFPLRVASPFPARLPPPEEGEEGVGQQQQQQPQQLRYGRLVDPTAINLEQCRHWVNHCATFHGAACNSPAWATRVAAAADDKPGAFLRMVDVVENRVVAVTGSDDAAARVRYCALSYVWGAPSRRAGLLELTEANARVLTGVEGVLRDNPKVGRTILDAMEVARRLGLRYLWADRLCIVQDSDADKRGQIAQMDRVYAGALVTIVAATAEHVDQGIAGVVPGSRMVHQVAVKVIAEPNVNVLLPLQSSIGGSSGGGGGDDGNSSALAPWSTRAWTLQEQLLSRRLLVFHDGVVDFVCPRGAMHEDMTGADAGSAPSPAGWRLSLAPSDTRRPPTTSRVRTELYGRRGPRLARASAFAEYAALLERFSPRRMSNPADGVNAVAGLLKVLLLPAPASSIGRLRVTPPPPLLHGLPEHFFDQALHWHFAAGRATTTGSGRSDKSGRVRMRLRLDPADGTTRLFPSWSWAAWEAVEEEEGDGRTRLCDAGVRYERPFRVQTDGWGALQKVVDAGEGKPVKGRRLDDERMRPLLTWYVVDRPPTALPPRAFDDGGADYYLRALNKTGLGVALDNASVSTDTWRAAVADAARPHRHNHQGLPSPALPVSPSPSSLRSSCSFAPPPPRIPASIAAYLDPVSQPSWALVFSTTCAAFSLGAARTRIETLWSRGHDDDDDDEDDAAGKDSGSKGKKRRNKKPPSLKVEARLAIRENPVLDRRGREVGRVVLPDPDNMPAPTTAPTTTDDPFDAHDTERPAAAYDFMLVSEAQYFGDERNVEVGEFPLFNVMLVHVWRRAENAILAERVAMGRVRKEAWWEAVYHAQKRQDHEREARGPTETVVVLL